MRLAPIEEPRSPLMRVAYWMCRRHLGAVITPFKVVYNRVPKSLFMIRGMARFTQTGLSLEPELAFLLKTFVAQRNGCGFCVDIAQAEAMRAQLDITKVAALADYEQSDVFSERERAAFAFAAEATDHKKVSDETFERLRKQFSEKEITEIVLLNAVENFYNLINLPLEIESDGLCALVPKR